MDTNLRVRMGIILVAVLASLWLLTPTFMGAEVQSVLAERAKWQATPEEDREEKTWPWWADWLPNRHVVLGLDLQGGTDVTLYVETEEAVLATVARDVPSLESVADADGVKLADARRERKAPNLLVRPGEGVTLEQVQGLVRRLQNRYAYDTTRTEADGSSWMVFKLEESEQERIAKDAVAQARQVIESRINESGVKEPTITLKGENGIDIQLPGEADADDAIETIKTTAQLEFILVDEESMRDTDAYGAVAAAVEEAKGVMDPKDFANDREVSNWLQDNGKLPPGTMARWEHQDNKRDKERTRLYILKDKVMLTGDDIANAQSTNACPKQGDWCVSLRFKDRGDQIFSQVTGDNVGRRFAIVLDDHVQSAPVINEKISGGASISMGANGVNEQIKQAGRLALVLRSGALPAPVSVGDQRVIGASLGEQAIREGVLATLIGSGLVFLFASVYYRMSGVVAVGTLLINGLLVVAALAGLGATLTLPGICGIALTIGMAVDCNIIFYERIREELRAGRGRRMAVELAFEHAFTAVFDANMTTLIAGIVLYSEGSGPLKGFAVTLMIGIFTTLFTGVFVSNSFMKLLVRNQPTSPALSI